MRISDWSSDVCSSDLGGGDGLSAEADRCRSGGGGAAGAWRDLAAAAVQPDERRPCALGAHPARLRTVRPQCVAIGSASCRERGCQYVMIPVVAVYLKKKEKKIQIE